MATNKDVELRIRARDYSQKTFAQLTKAYQGLIKVQELQTEQAKKGEVSARDLEKTYDRLADAGKQLLKLDALTRTFENQNKALTEAAAKTEAARVKLRELNAEYAAAETKTKKQEAAIAAAGKAVERLTAAETKRRDAVARVASELERYGISTDNLAESQADFAAGVTKVNTALEQQEKALNELGANRAAAQLRKDAEAQAAAAESASKRVVDGLLQQADQALATARGYRTLGRVVVTTSKQIGGVGDSIQQIIAPAEFARKTLSGLETQVTETAKAINKSKASVADLKNNLRQLGEAQKQIVGLAGLADQFRNQVAAVRAARNEYNAAKAEVSALAEQLKVSGANVEQLGQRMQSAQQRLSTVTRELNAQTEAARRTQQALRQAGVDTTKLAEAEARLASSATQTAVAANKAADAIKRKARAAGEAIPIIERLASSSRESLSMYQRVRGEVIALATAYVGLQGAINLAGGSVDAYKLREQSLIKISAAVGLSQEALAAEWEYMVGLADKLGISIDVLAPSYTKFAVAAKAAGMTMQETRFIFESFAKSAAVLQLSQADIEGTFRAIEQVISKGQVYAEELRGQLGERLPGAVSLFAEATGRSIAELNKALENGEVSSREIINFAGANAKRIDAQLEVANKSVAAAEGRLATAQTLFKLAIADAGFIDAYANAINKITEFLKSQDGKDLAKGIAEGFIALGDAVAWCADNVETLKSIFVILLGLKIGGWLIGLGAQAVVAAGQLGTLIAALRTAIGTAGIAGIAGAAGTAAAGLGVLRLAFAALLRAIPFVGAALIAWDIGTLIYDQTEIGKNAIDALVTSIKGLPTTIEAALSSIPAIWKDLMAAMDGDDSFKNVKEVWRQAADDIKRINKEVVEDDQAKYDQMLKQSKEFANKMAKSLGQRVPLSDDPNFKGVPFRSPDQAPDFLFTKDPGTGVTTRDRQIIALTKSFDKLAEAAQKANKSSKELEQRKSLTGRLKLIDEEFADQMKKAMAIGGAEGDKLVKRLQEIITLRKQAEEREFKAQNVGAEDQRLTQVRKLQEEYDRLFAGIETKSSKIDPTKTFAERLRAMLQEMDVGYDQLIAKAERLGGVEGRNLADKFKKLQATNREYLTEKARLEELKRLQDESMAQQNTKKALIEEVNALREAGLISEAEQVRRVTEINNQLNASIQQSLLSLQAFVLTMKESLTPEQFAQINAQIAQMQAGLTSVAGQYTEMDTMVVNGVLQGMQTALDSVYDSLVNVVTGAESWGDAMQNLGETVARFFADFLLQIAKAILQQMLLNAIAGWGGGIGSAAKSLGGVVSHNGGVVGDKSSGTGAQSRAVSPSWFANAPRFHSGGFPGLRPDEVPTILQRGEQVLSKDDPNNILNSKGSGGGGSALENSVHLHVNQDPSDVAAMAWGKAGQEHFQVYLRQNASTVKQILGVKS